ncbi:MAG: hypothetical protein AAF741_14310 [Bacteroidota bacterium]
MLENSTSQKADSRKQGINDSIDTVYIIESLLITFLGIYFILNEYSSVHLPRFGLRYFYIFIWIAILCGLFGIHQFVVSIVQLFGKPSRTIKGYFCCSAVYLLFFLAIIFTDGYILEYINIDVSLILVSIIPVLLTWWFTMYQIRSRKRQSVVAEVDREDILDFFE